jgi:hypothetical protein
MHVRQQNLDFPEDVVAVQALADGPAVLARPDDDRNGHSDQHRRQRQSDSSIAWSLDQNLRPNADIKETAPARVAEGAARISLLA